MSLDYTVVDNDKACDRGKEIFSGQRPIYLKDSGKQTSVSDLLLPSDKVNFRTVFDDGDGDVDVLICTITLLYVNDLSSIISLIEQKRPRLVFFSCFLINSGDKPLKLAQIFPDFGAYAEITAHSASQIKSSFMELGYKEMTATGNYEIEDVEGFSTTCKEHHPDVRIADLFFSYE